jgi:hypothetical protein
MIEAIAESEDLNELRFNVSNAVINVNAFTDALIALEASPDESAAELVRRNPRLMALEVTLQTEARVKEANEARRLARENSPIPPDHGGYLN